MRARHKYVRPPCYNAWCAMRKACGIVRGYPPKARRLYEGIDLCPEWRENYGAFEEWALRHGWFKGAHLTRRDKRGDFCPENCFWCTRAVANGYRSNILRLPDGRSVRDLLGTERLGRDEIEHMRLKQRLFGTHGYAPKWDVECAMAVTRRCYGPYDAARARAELARGRADGILEIQQKGSTE